MAKNNANKPIPQPDLGPSGCGHPVNSAGNCSTDDCWNHFNQRNQGIGRTQS